MRYKQKWGLSCEYAATHIALRLLGFDVSEDVMQVLLGSGEDPDVTFRGAINAVQTLENYGVHARGIARLVELLKDFGHLPGSVRTSLLYNLDGIHQAIVAGEPVVAWVPLHLRASSRVPVRLSSGKVVNLVYAEHAVTVHGYDQEGVTVVDPHAAVVAGYEAGAFVRGMSLFDDPALAIGLARPAPVPAPTSQHFPETGITLDGGFFLLYRDLGGRDALGVPLTHELNEPDVQTGAGKQVIYTENARMEWYPGTRTFGLGFVGQELLGDEAAPDPRRRLIGDIGRYFTATGGVRRWGYSISEEVPFDPADERVPRRAGYVVGQWFQAGLLLYARDFGVLPGRAGLALARQRGLVQ